MTRREKFKACLNKYDYDGISQILKHNKVDAMIDDLTKIADGSINYVDELEEARNDEKYGKTSKICIFYNKLGQKVIDYFGINEWDKDFKPTRSFLLQLYWNTNTVKKILKDFNDPNFKPAEKTLKRR